jgi:FkbM family methyltransferase
MQVPFQKLLRPGRLVDSFRVRRFRRAFAALPIDETRTVLYLGTPYGGWAVPDGLIGREWVCYCVGAGEDISFELALMDRYDCEVVSFDPSEGSELHAREAAEGRESFRFMRVGVADRDGTMKMWTALEPEHVALSAANLQRTDTAMDVPIRSLPSVMAELGHERIDLLKLAVEGLEYDLVPKLDLSGMGVKVFGLEFTQLRPPAEAGELVRALRSRGYVPIFRNPSGGEPARTTMTFVRDDR